MDQVQFQPTGKRVDVPAGTNLLEAARNAGIELSSVCGGMGSCGQCQVTVLKGQVSPPNVNEVQILSSLELLNGRRLGCCAQVAGSLVVEIPKSSVLSNQRLQLESEIADLGNDSLDRPMDPLVRAYHLQLEKPNLQDVRSDLTRLVDAIHAVQREQGQADSTFSANALSANADVIRTLPEIARKNEWRITAFVRGDEIVGVGRYDDQPLGYAVDLGTTKIAASLVNLETGQTLASAGTSNPQVGYGEDVISRLNYVQRGPDGGQVLADKVRAALNDLLGELAAQAGVERRQVVEACIVGNTAMTHLLLRLPVRQLAMAPYVAAVSEALEVHAHELGLDIAPGAYAYIPPCVGGFVGADHVAMILACDLDQSKRIALGIDIGTNTEVVMRKPGLSFLSSASCASGPAFEGAHISEGMRAASGAIEKVRLTEDGLELITIQDEAPIGLCGSGMIDAAAELRRWGLISQHGMLNLQSPRVRKGENGGEFLLSPAEHSGTGREIVINQKDINEIQLAKGAIRAGIQILLNLTETALEEVQEVIIAGAFGSYLDIENAIAIGLLPRLPNAHYRQVGNAALVGARWMLLSQQARQRAQAIQHSARYQELTLYPKFSRTFALAMLFPDLED